MSGTWADIQVCGPQGCGGDPPMCIASSICIAGGVRCNGVNAEACNASGTAWVTLETCDAACSQGACVECEDDGACDAGTVP
jgi:hypothetical protein